MRVIPVATGVMRCRPCLSRAPAGSCGKPVEAGLADGVGVVVWPPHGYECHAFRLNPDAMPEPSAERLRRQWEGKL